MQGASESIVQVASHYSSRSLEDAGPAPGGAPPIYRLSHVQRRSIRLFKATIINQASNVTIHM